MFFSLCSPVVRHSTTAAIRRWVVAAVATLAFGVGANGRVLAADTLAKSGVAMVPQDAAFLSATLRLREQIDLFLKSNAFAAIQKLPSMVRALESFEEQQSQPGSPLSIAATFLEMPENEQAIELLNDMISSDTFLYGEPSCVTFVELLKKLQQAQQTASILSMARGNSSFGGLGLNGVGDGFGVDDVIEAEDAELEDVLEDADDGAAAPPVRNRFLPVRFQAADAEEQISSEQIMAQLIVKTLADNVDSIAMPDIVWGFQTTKLEAAKFQLRRIEVLIKAFSAFIPDFADALKRQKIAGGEVVSFTLESDKLPWDELIQTWDDFTHNGAEGVDPDQLEKVLDKLKSLKIVVALGIIGDRVILSIGDSIEHLNKLSAGGSDQPESLLTTKPFAPLREQQEKRITAISYISKALAQSLAASADDIEHLANLVVTLAESADLPEGAAEEASKDLKRVASGYRKRLPLPGPWMAFSFLNDKGYEGYIWNWSKNLQLDGSKRLELLEHAGGNPLGAFVVRAKNDPTEFEDFVLWTDMAWSFFQKYLLPKADEESQKSFAEFDEHIAPLGVKLVGILRKKILPSLADGQIGFVLDAKSKSKRLQKDLPASADPLPLIEPAIVLALADPDLFRDGINDLFALTDELVDEIREVNPDAVPADYEVPVPFKTKVEGGTVWSFAIPDAGLDEQVQPAVGIGRDVAVFSLLPKHAARLLEETPLKTGAELSKFSEPLAGAVALDWPGLIDAIQPWVVYLTRYGCVQQQDGEVDPETILDADAENEQAKDALQQAAVVFEALKTLRVAVAETAIQADAIVTHWRNIIRDTN